MWKTFKHILLSVGFLKAAVISLLFFTIVLFFLIDNTGLIFIILALFSAALFYLYYVRRFNRLRELGEIKNAIAGIRNNQIRTQEELILSEPLADVQQEIRLMYEKINSNIVYLKKLEKMRTEFIANTSHELRTPVFAIQGFIETLLDGALDDPKVNKLFLQKAVKHTENLNALLNDLIDISMIESGEMRMHFRYFQVNEFVGQIIEELKGSAGDKHLDLVYISAERNLSLFGDKEKLRQVLINLVQNAIQYTDQGSVKIIVEEEAKTGKIMVKDTGMGIPEKDIHRIFERFYRVDKARSRYAGGTGLGLAIVKHIIEAHDSKIDVKSSLNEGSEFSFCLRK